MSIALLDPNDPGYKAAVRRLKKSQKSFDHAPSSSWTPFRAAEKLYMQKFPPPDLSAVLDLASGEEDRALEMQHSRWKGSPTAFPTRRLYHRNAHVVDNVPGLVLLPSYVDHSTQRALVRWALSEHARAPNETNLDAHYLLPPSGLWQTLLTDPSSVIAPKHRSDGAIHEREGPRQLVNNVAGGLDTFAELNAMPKLPPAPSPNAKAVTASSLLPRLRWANIGYSYHWGSKSYDFSKGNGVFPERIAELCRQAVASVDWQEVWKDVNLDGWGNEGPDWPSWATDYSPDAGIVNFYQLSDTLMGHVDRSEVSATSPLVSISLGSAAVFLIGSTTRDTPPLPILLRSGDVLIMSGPHCRRAYHGVPRILDKTIPPHLKQSLESDEDWAPYAAYLETTRINANVRQGMCKD
ncbi:hypothetical protein EXIGLDRAFT_678500 [Exidia glandulosa HHB12029]|uniref:Fe2OG dioxygenase domain-containing protein n=1 Tax=Exidia glandulosa HHB12029 TaxID=1314781 RepID=A0A165FE89_EXIGL|nr:hypothetical protein EXIGLDRAFT_678500 [Exidia glandulosa HHB12029]